VQIKFPIQDASPPQSIGLQVLFSTPKWKLPRVMKINWKEIFKFLSGAFFVVAGASWYLSWYRISVPFFGFTVTPKFLAFRGFMHFALFLISFYLGFVRK
jgi:hypothetical protein